VGASLKASQSATDGSIKKQSSRASVIRHSMRSALSAPAPETQCSLKETGKHTISNNVRSKIRGNRDLGNRQDNYGEIKWHWETYSKS
jgi:hypothetical protein